jgi:hypothetical protein
LTQELDKFEALRAGKRLADAGDLFVELALDFSHAYNLTIV